MPPAYAAYTAISSGLFAILLPTVGAGLAASSRYRKGFMQRLGFYPKPIAGTDNGTQRIWFHAASVGEIGVAVSIMKALKTAAPSCEPILSTTTVHGRTIGEKMAAGTAECVYAPVDFIGSIRLALSMIRPDIMVWVETELWPNWMVQAKRMGVKTAVVNGRISPRAQRRYGKVKRLFLEVLPSVDALSMIGKGDAERIARMGALSDRITVNGNAKYDQLAEKTTARLRMETAAKFNIEGDRPVFVAGSIRAGEDRILLDAYGRLKRKFPELLLVIAPRHIQKAAGVVRMAREKGYDGRLRSARTSGREMKEDVIVLDTYGELFGIYSLATLTFCGGSLVPKGGQNPMEAAAWGHPVLFGKSMEDFEDARNLLTAGGGGFTVTDGKDLARCAAELLASRQKRKDAGTSARRVVENLTGTAHKHAAVIGNLLRHPAV